MCEEERSDGRERSCEPRWRSEVRRSRCVRRPFPRWLALLCPVLVVAVCVWCSALFCSLAGATHSTPFSPSPQRLPPCTSCNSTPSVSTAPLPSPAPSHPDRDGIFLGDEYTAADIEFIVANKVTHIINCAGREVKNSWERIGISYLTFRWRRLEDKAFDSKGIVISQIRKFIQNAVNSAQSVLIHSKDGTSRAPAAAAAFFMTEYGWGLRKTMQFFHIKRDGEVDGRGV